MQNLKFWPWRKLPNANCAHLALLNQPPKGIGTSLDDEYLISLDKCLTRQTDY